ncbi:2220_t:CDS:2, partial [Entrophospora sp. SA101]
VLAASDELLLEELYEFVEDHLIKNKSNWIKENYVEVLHTIYLLPKCVKLKEYCLSLICESPKSFFASTSFLTIEKNILHDLLKRDDLSMEETDIWTSLIEWGIYQTNLNSDVTTWNGSDILRVLVASDELLLDELILVASDELLLDELYEFIEDHLIKNQSNWIKENYVEVLHTIYLLPKCVKLKEYCLNSICESPKPFFASTSFPTIEKNILHDLLKRDDLNMEETGIWTSLIEWGIYQTNLNSDVTTW